jgi:ribose transport system permease protein
MSEMTSTTVEPTEKPARRRLNAGVVRARDNGIIGVAAILFLALSLAAPAFLTVGNLQNLLDQWAPLGIMAAAMTLVLIAGGFDLSAGAVFAFSGVIAAQATNALGVVPGILLALAAGTIIGLANGLLVTVGRINPFVATLASGIILSGVTLAMTGGLIVSVTDPGFSFLGQGKVVGVRVAIFILILVLVAMGLLLHRTVFGRHVFAVGGNPEAARLSGIRVGLVQTMTYVLLGSAAALAGTIAASRVASAEANAGGISLLFTVFAIVVVGGTSLKGGDGAIWRTLVGLIVLALIGNSFVLLNLSAVYQQISEGAIIMAAVALDAWTKSDRKTG